MHKLNIVFDISLHVKNKLLANFTRKFSNATKKSIKTPKVETMKVLNVAEKNDAAKNIAGYLSRGTSNRREGLSKFNKIYEFNSRLWNQDCTMIMTSVSGHLLGFDFEGAYRKWYSCPPLSLFDAPVVKQCPEDSYQKIKRTIEKEVKTCGALIIWTDCDREGENIGFEIIDVCKAVKPNIKVYRAKFSEITQASIDRALRSLEAPNKALSDAVDVRSELDLRIGAAFTRFQTMRLQKTFPTKLAEMLISYGPCQFPTLGFVVERFLAIERFQPEPYWKIKVMHEQNNLNVEFRWARNRLFEELPCKIFLDICRENPQAKVEKVTSKEKKKWRPLPLDTIELEKQGSRKLRLSAKETMKIAEKLYTQGFISYPRTETNIFPKEMNLAQLVTHQSVENAAWGRFAQQLLEQGVNPRQGKKSDQAHPPIHPIKYTNSLTGNEARVYEFIVRHFLACVSKDAEGFETLVEIDIAGEKFVTNGLQIVAKNYLEVYIYERWNTKEIHIYQQGQTFMPTSIDMLEESTSPPNLLTEADLIGLMDKHGIGTDATHAEHIETIKSRQYVGLKDNKYLLPGKLGIGLVMGYDRMGFQMSKPNLRAELENDLKLICDGLKSPDEVRQRTIDKYREVFREAMIKANLIDEALSEYLEERPQTFEEAEVPAPIAEVPILKCPKCNSNMVLKTKRSNNGKYIGCNNYPTCNNVIWFPDGVEDVEVLNENCNTCPSNVLKKIKVKLVRGAFPVFGINYTSCIGGCDDMFNTAMGIRSQCVKRSQGINNDTGYKTNTSSRSTASSTHRTNTFTASTRTTQSNQNQRNNEFSGSIWGSNNGCKETSYNQNSWDNQQSNNWKVPSSTSNSNTGGNSMQNFNWAQGDSEGEIVCNCHQPAKELRVRKAGPNQGRIFYKCAKPIGQGCDFFLWGDSDCSGGGVPAAQRPAPTDNWNQGSDQQNYQNQSSSRHNYQGSLNQRQNNQNTFNVSGNWGDNSGGGNNEPTCSCGQLAKKLTVQKEGPNKSRQFYGCPKGPSSTCNFFKWADELDSGGSGFDGGGPGGGGGYDRGNKWSYQPPSRGRGRGRGGTEGGASKKPRNQNPGGNKRKCGICGVEGHTKRTCPQNAMD